ncbi:pentatricopeptide repeat-containing protein At1g50270 [Ananas comosus]|uniref:Pentatricopeptide repeat-containing protein At1g50270 n=1 Tax=Ananas comosus TaxID=4615 RepID=A0A6P5H303_ANACO|nr:pentatricopeptide repeat-containing protein At1g50270 [Ananas comosus]
MRSHHRCSIAISIHTQKLREGASPTKHTYPLLLKAVSNSGARSPTQIHAQILKFGFDSDSFVHNSLVSAYAKSRDLRSAQKLFDRCSRRDYITWDAMIHGYVENNRAMEGLTLFKLMRSTGVDIDGVTVVSVLKGSGVVGDVWFGKCVHGFYVACGRVRRDSFVGTALVDMYAKCGEIDEAKKVFDEMPYRGIVSWGALIAGYERCGLFKEALFVSQAMLAEGVKPNQVTLTSALTACTQLGALDQGKWIHAYVERNRLELNSFVGTALIDLYAKCGCVDDAFAVFEKLPRKDVYPWTALINGLAMNGRGLECLDLFDRMLKERIAPNEVTLIALLSACAHSGLVDQGRVFFENMFKDYGVKPKLEHYGCMIDMLGRAGRLEEALCVIKSMPMEPSSALWGALLGACLVHKDYELGERIGKHLIDMEPYDSGKYAMVANMHALSRKWEEAANVRKSMKGRKVEKSSGCSWIEVGGVVHEFIALDGSHSQSKDVYEVLDGLIGIMKMEGFEPSSSLWLVAVDVI